MTTMNKISLKKKWVATSGWRGYEVPVNSIAGANDTGSYPDSPCPSRVCKKEIGDVKNILRKAGIRHKTTFCQSSNVFCISRHICVAPEDRDKAIELTREYIDNNETDLIWIP